MRSGEITLQKIRINKKLKDKKTVALDVLKMLNEFDEKEKDKDKGNKKTDDLQKDTRPGAFVEKKFGGANKPSTLDADTSDHTV